MRRFLHSPAVVLVPVVLVVLGVLAYALLLRPAAPPSFAYRQGWDEAQQGIMRQPDQCDASTAYLPSSVSGSGSDYRAAERADFDEGCRDFFLAARP